MKFSYNIDFEKKSFGIKVRQEKILRIFYVSNLKDIILFPMFILKIS